MPNLPIEFQKVKVSRESVSLSLDPKPRVKTEVVQYLVTVSEKGQFWKTTALCSRQEIIDLRDKLNKLLADITTAELLSIPEPQAKAIDTAYSQDALCQSCEYQLTHNCTTCLFTLQSPLEQKLFLGLKRANISFEVQYGLNWRGEHVTTEGKTYNDPRNNFKEVLTIPDFFIEKNRQKLCIYTDGHTYHERTEEQAQRDRNIDRKLQELGFRVLRYTGKEVNENLIKVISEVKNWIDKSNAKRIY
jgi:hypothetical protein